jgi:hypothetical protein
LIGWSFNCRPALVSRNFNRGLPAAGNSRPAAIRRQQCPVQRFLCPDEECCTYHDRARENAKNHLAGETILVRPKLQAMCRLKYCRKNAVNNQSHNGRNDDDNDRRN